MSQQKSQFSFGKERGLFATQWQTTPLVIGSPGSVTGNALVSTNGVVPGWSANRKLSVNGLRGSCETLNGVRVGGERLSLHQSMRLSTFAGAVDIGGQAHQIRGTDHSVAAGRRSCRTR
jgi:hypothetical protein